MIKLKYILYGLSIILADIVVYMILGLLLMRYDDFYDESKGEYWSLGSMTLSEKIPYIGINIWNLVNLVALGYLIFRLIRWMKIRKTRHNTQYSQKGF